MGGMFILRVSSVDPRDAQLACLLGFFRKINNTLEMF
jgi:hypothetical protein